MVFTKHETDLYIKRKGKVGYLNKETIELLKIVTVTSNRMGQSRDMKMCVPANQITSYFYGK